MKQHGLIIVFTGEGKGKTSAALGIAMRASGHGMYVSLVHFIKTPACSGEERSADRLKPELEIVAMGKGFVNQPESTVSLEEHRKAAEDAFALASQRLLSGFWDVLILDEINIAVSLGLLDVQKVVALLKRKPSKLHVVLTGRNAHPAIVEIADMVTEMRLVKHPFGDQGLPAQKGIDF